MKPLGSYVAKRCPRRVQLDIVQPVEQLEAAPDAIMRMEAGVEFEASIVEHLGEVAAPEWVFAADDLDRTQAAMDGFAPVIVNARLPNDHVEWRSGAPDVMVWHDDGYLPIDVKHHKTMSDGDGMTVSALHSPFPASGFDEPHELRANKDDALQLAHYRRMLEGAGAASTSSLGGIIGKEGVVAWYDLDVPMWTTPAKSDGKKRKKRTTMEAYDFEFGIRRSWAIEAHAHLEDSTVPLLQPVDISDCRSCGWDVYCAAELHEGSGDPSLLPRIGYSQWRLLQDHGIGSRQQVADLDYLTARLGGDGVALADWIELSRAALPTTRLEELNSRRTKQLRMMAEEGITTAGEYLAAIEPRTASLGKVTWLDEAILNARAVLGPESAYLRPGIGTPVVPRADIELDIDMENVEEGVYLWGVLVTDRAGTGLVEEGFVPFHSFDPMTEEIESSIFDEFWTWLGEVTERCADAGVTLKSYCWFEVAENRQFRSIAGRDRRLAEDVEAFIASDRWVDLHKTFKSQWITGESTSLKAIAPMAGFTWNVDDPGGGIAMVRYEEAISGSAEAAQWLLTYNEGDVVATREIRGWLSRGQFEEVAI